MDKQIIFDRDSWIILVDPIQDWSTWKTCAHSLIEPLGLELIGAVLQEAGYKVKVLQAQGKKLDDLFVEIKKYSPQIVALTSYTYNSNDALNLAKKIKDNDKNVIIIYGGYHATYFPELVRNSAVDFIIKGPGEIVTLELIETIEKRGDLRDIGSIAYIDQNGKLINNYTKKYLFDLDKIPFAIRDADILKGCSISSMMYPPQSKQKLTAAIYASRGCPYSCSYCTSPSFYKHAVKFRSASIVALEIEKLYKEFNVNVLFFTDLTFNLKRNYVIEICNEIIKKRLEIFWYALFRPEGVDRELAKILKKAGCSKVALGIESFDINILKRVNRGGEYYLNNIKEMCQNLHREGILVRGLLIVGYPWETHETYKKLDDTISDLPIDELRVGILTPFPGTQIHNQLKIQNKIFIKDYRYYDSRHVTFKHDHLMSKDVCKYAENIFNKYNKEAHRCAQKD